MSRKKARRYPELHRSGELKERARTLSRMLSCCQLCPHECGIDRTRGDRGHCGASHRVRVASAQLHFGEEAPISGFSGSGTIFFSHCTLTCSFCQNNEISQQGRGFIQDADLLADSMLELQRGGAHNINLVTPTHYLPMILEALEKAAENRLHIPIVYNTSGWESVEMIRMLDGVVDIYMPDMKYADEHLSVELSGCPRYPRIALSALMEMARQVGPLELDENGVALRGLLVRHLILPGYLENTMAVIDLLEQHVPAASLSILSQYHPSWNAAFRADDLSRFLDQDERKIVAERLTRSPLHILKQWN